MGCRDKSGNDRNWSSTTVRHQSLQKHLALAQFRYLDPLTGLVRLFDRAWAADDGGDAYLQEIVGFRATDHDQVITGHADSIMPEAWNDQLRRTVLRL